jgi:hypothetical protein
MPLWGLGAGAVEGHVEGLGARGSRERGGAGGRQVVGILVRLAQYEKTGRSFGRWCVLPLSLMSRMTLGSAFHFLCY